MWDIVTFIIGVFVGIGRSGGGDRKTDKAAILPGTFCLGGGWEEKFAHGSISKIRR